MKVTVLQENLVKALATAGRIISSRPQMPILSHVLLKATKDGLELEATNLEIGWKTTLGAKVDEEGVITVPTRTFLELVSNLGSGKIVLEAIEELLTIEGAGMKAQVNGNVSDDFPSLPVTNKDQGLRFSAKPLRGAISKVVFAAAVDESRPVLTAVLMRLKRGNLELVGTDGFRLSIVGVSSEIDNDSEHEWLVPAKSVLELERLLDEDVEEIVISTVEGGNQVIFSVGETELSSRLVSGTYPPYKKILPEAGDTRVEMDKDDFMRAMKLAAVFARESANIVKLEVGDSSLVVRANAASVGKNEASVDAKVTGPGGGIAFNYRYILDFLNVVDAKLVAFEMTGSLAAGLWTEGKGKDFVHVIMPVRLEEEG